MEDRKIKVVSTTGRVGIELPELHFRKQWLSKGATVTMTLQEFQDIFYDPGTQYMFESGILYTEDMEAKKLVGLEPEDATEPVNIIILDNSRMERLMLRETMVDFRQDIKKLTYEQLLALCDYAIENRYVNMDKCDLLKEICGKDIIAAIRLNDADKEK